MIKIGNRVKETTDSTGTGPIDLAGTSTGFFAFADEFTNGDEVYYLIVDDPDNPTSWEIGVGTFTAGTPDTLSRDAVEDSSNSGNKVSFVAGTKTVISTPTAAMLGGEGPLSTWALKSAAVLAKTADYTVVAADDGELINADGSGNSPVGLQINLPAVASSDKHVQSIINTGASGAITIDANGAETINGATTLVLSAQFDWAIVWCDGTEWHALVKPVATASLPRSFLAGLGMTNAADADHDITVAAGKCRDDADAEDMALASAITKRIDAAWAVGTGNGGLDTGSVANATWYHVWLIKRTDTGVVDALFSTSPTAPTMPTNYDAKRRLGSVLTDGSANIIAFTQYGDNFRWNDPPLDVDDATPGTSAHTEILTVPTGVVVEADINVRCNSAYFYVSPLTVNDEAPSGTTAPLAQSGTSTATNNVDNVLVFTDASAQIRWRVDANAQAYIATLGWIDRRGRDD